jgi:hypothetical protein
MTTRETFVGKNVFVGIDVHKTTKAPHKPPVFGSPVC